MLRKLDLSDVIALQGLLGLALLTTGAALVAVPLGFIVPGLVLLSLSLYRLGRK